MIGLVLFVLFPRTGVYGQADSAKEGDLFTATIEQDLTTAATSELIDWAITLGLSTRGSRRDVEDRILAYYGIDRTDLTGREEVGTPERALSVASIRNARGSEYFTIQQTNERYLRLIGGVELTMEDETAVHTIIAEELTINLERKTLAATGLVEYSVQRADETETFRGETVVFHIQNWDGLFLGGYTDTGRAVDDGAQNFTLFGKRITRSGNDVVVVDGGVITSSVADPPNYEIRARRIWILAPGEWGIRNATLYVGRVPMLYIPWFFFPGDRLFFNPAVGVRNREGAFIQTTTYFFGQSEDSDPPFSIMQIAEAPTDQQREIRGLYLRIPDEPKKVTRPDWTLKMMADVYTTLGYYGGIAGSQPDWGPFESLNWRIGVGASRNIYMANGVYTSYYIDELGQARRRWNTGYFANTELPFRYETELDSAVSFPDGSWTVRYEMLSDPRFRNDFGRRSENIDWTKVLNQTLEAEPVASEVSSLRWETQLRWNPTLPGLRPWITSLQISSLRGDLRWSSRENMNPPPPITVPESHNSPEARFFYPDTAVFPDIALEMRGTLLNLFDSDVGDHDEPSGTDLSEEIDADIRPPWEQRTKVVTALDERFRLPDRAADLPGIDTSRRDTKLTLGYTIRPSLRVDRVSDSAGWQSSDDIDFGWRYSTLQNRNRGVLSLRFITPGGWLHYDGTVTGEHRYQSVDFFSGIDDPEKTLLNRAAYAFRGETLTQSSVITAYPLLEVPRLDRSSLRYELVTRLYERSFDTTAFDSTGYQQFITRYGGWNADGVRTHTGSGTLRWKIWGAEQSLTAKAVLPPLDRVYTGNLTAITGPVTSSLGIGIREIGDEKWRRDPLVETHRLETFGGKLTGMQRLEYDMEEFHVLQSTSRLHAWPLRWEVVGRRTEGVEFVPAVGWQDQGEPAFRWTSMAFGLGGEPEFRLWKRRIDVGLKGALLYEADLQRFTSSSLVLDYGFSLDIYRFLTLSVTARSRNDLVYQYDPSKARTVGRPYRNPIEDLVDSLRFTDREARERSSFKIESVEIRGVHDLQDWELSFSYVAGPELVTRGGRSSYEWDGVFAVLFRWRPISEIRRDIRVDDGLIEFVES